MQCNRYNDFLALHQQKYPLLLGNAWNVASAQLLEKNGCKAIATSSAAVANSLGYADGEAIPFSELFFIVKRILSCISIPLSVDMETGYSRHIDEVIQHIEQLHDAGAAGINLEDSQPVGGEKQLVDIDAFSKKIEAIKSYLQKRNKSIFINARTDGFLLNVPSPLETTLETTLERIKAYSQAGADGIFILFLSDKKIIRQITDATSLPVNMICMPDLPSIDELAALGVRRISLGDRFYRSVYDHAERMLREMRAGNSFSPLFEK